MNKIIIPLVDLKANYQSIKSEIDRKINEVISSGSFIQGKYVESFEEKFAKFCDAKYCIGVGSGTEALHLSLMAMGVGKDDEVIVPVNTFVATAYAALYVGAKPVLVDVDEYTSNIDVFQLEQKITKKTKLIIPVHLYGQCAQMDAIKKIARKYKLLVLEDACQAHGAEFNGERAGSIGDMATFSFYPGKNLGAYGDGGAITTNSKVLMQKIKKLREYGSVKKYFFQSLGFNSRLDALQAAILEVKLKHLDSWNRKRQKAAAYYDKKISQELGFIKPVKNLPNATSVYHLYVIQTAKRDKLLSYLAANAVYAGIHYPLPLHLQESLKQLGYKKGDFPVAERLSQEILSLPIYPEITTSLQDQVIRYLKEFYGKN